MFWRLPPTLPALLVSLSVTAVGCDTDVTEPPDAEDASFFLAGKADGAAFDPDLAAGVVSVANEASFEILYDSEHVGLHWRAAAGIVEARSGSDGVDGTSDDMPFATLEQLDAVPWVGPVAFERLQEYALAHGYVDAAPQQQTQLAQCQGEFPPSQIQAAHSNGWVEFDLAEYERHCDVDQEQIDCSPWTEVELESPHPRFTPTVEGHSLDIEASDGQISVRGGHAVQWLEGTLEVRDDETVLEMDLGYKVYECYSSSHCYARDVHWATLRGPVTRDCISVSRVERTDEMQFAPGVESYTERALVAFSG